MAREDLAAAVRLQEAGGDEQGANCESPADTSTDILASLHHTHMPKFEEAGLVTYNADKGTAAFEGHPALETEWFEMELLDRAPYGRPLPVEIAARESSDV